MPSMSTCFASRSKAPGKRAKRLLRNLVALGAQQPNPMHVPRSSAPRLGILGVLSAGVLAACAADAGGSSDTTMADTSSTSGDGTGSKHLAHPL